MIVLPAASVSTISIPSSLLPAMMDVALLGLGYALCVAVFWQTAWISLAVWTFFLTQALFCFIPNKARKGIAHSERDGEQLPVGRRGAGGVVREGTTVILGRPDNFVFHVSTAEPGANQMGMRIFQKFEQDIETAGAEMSSLLRTARDAGGD